MADSVAERALATNQPNHTPPDWWLSIILGARPRGTTVEPVSATRMEPLQSTNSKSNVFRPLATVTVRPEYTAFEYFLGSRFFENEAARRGGGT